MRREHFEVSLPEYMLPLFSYLGNGECILYSIYFMTVIHLEILLIDIDQGPGVRRTYTKFDIMPKSVTSNAIDHQHILTFEGIYNSNTTRLVWQSRDREDNQHIGGNHMQYSIAQS